MSKTAVYQTVANPGMEHSSEKLYIILLQQSFQSVLKLSMLLRNQILTFLITERFWPLLLLRVIPHPAVILVNY